jgi:hypothetical protein
LDSRLVVPTGRLSDIFVHPETIPVHIAERQLCQRVPLPGVRPQAN